MMNTAVTFDEPNYITAGYTYWLTHDYRLNFEHPPLAKLITGFPILFLHPNINLDSEHWVAAGTPEAAYREQWGCGHLESVK